MNSIVNQLPSSIARPIAQIYNQVVGYINQRLAEAAKKDFGGYVTPISYPLITINGTALADRYVDVNLDAENYELEQAIERSRIEHEEAEALKEAVAVSSATKLDNEKTQEKSSNHSSVKSCLTSQDIITEEDLLEEESMEDDGQDYDDSTYENIPDDQIETNPEIYSNGEENYHAEGLDQNDNVAYGDNFDKVDEEELEKIVRPVEMAVKRNAFLDKLPVKNQ